MAGHLSSCEPGGVEPESDLMLLGPVRKSQKLLVLRASVITSVGCDDVCCSLPWLSSMGAVSAACFNPWFVVLVPFLSFSALVLAVPSPSPCLQCRWWDLESSCRQESTRCSSATWFSVGFMLLLYVPVGLAGHLFRRSFEPGGGVGLGAALNLRAT